MMRLSLGFEYVVALHDDIKARTFLVPASEGVMLEFLQACPPKR